MALLLARSTLVAEALALFDRRLVTWGKMKRVTTPGAPIGGLIKKGAGRDQMYDWYEAFDFQRSPSDPHHLFLLMKDLQAPLGD